MARAGPCALKYAGRGLARLCVLAAYFVAESALLMGESGPAVLNAANEVAVGAFLSGKLPFVEIVPTVRETLRAHTPTSLSSLDDALSWDLWGRETATERLSSFDNG